MRKLSVAVLLLAACSGQRAERLNAEGRGCLERRDWRCAVTAFSGAAAAAPGISKYRYNLGLALARANAYEQARTEFETAIRLDPANLDARKALRIVTDTLSDDQAADIAAQLQR